MQEFIDRIKESEMGAWKVEKKIESIKVSSEKSRLLAVDSGLVLFAQNTPTPWRVSGTYC